MKIEYIIVETDRYMGELQIGFYTIDRDKVALMEDFLILVRGKKQYKVANRFYSMAIARAMIKKLEKHNEKMEKLI